MSVVDVAGGLRLHEAGEEMYRLVEDLYPIGRSITGEGVRRTLRRLQNEIALTVHEVPTGTRVFDWSVPKEWNVRDAYVKNARGERVIDYRRSTLHLVGYSVPVRARMRLDELRPHLHTLPEHPAWIPFRTSYYRETWGFCLAHEDLARLPDGEYEVVIDTTLEDGALTYGEYAIEGQRRDEVLLSCHVCHPSLCNDNLSGIALATLLARVLTARAPRYSYRFLFVPGTIGSITWLARNRDRLPGIAHGLVLACLGDPGRVTYKRSRRGDAAIDRAARHVLAAGGRDHEIVDFTPWGYDERQYCSPAFDLPIGCLSRTPHGRFPEYHTSGDDLTLVRPEALADSLGVVLEILGVLEGDARYLSTNPAGEPQLGRRGLYRALGGESGLPGEMPLLWVLNQADGRHTLLDVAERSGIAFRHIRRAADLLLEHGLLEDGDAEGDRP